MNYFLREGLNIKPILPDYFLITLLFVFSFSPAIGQDGLCLNLVPIQTATLGQNQVFNNKVFWEAGKIINIGFINGVTHLQNKVKEYSAYWSNEGNIKFQFIDNWKSADIRISFYEGKGSWSLIGTDSKFESADPNTGSSIAGTNGPSMNFGWFDNSTSEKEFKRVILHEFGHALGLLHEQENPLTSIQWNKEKVYAEFKSRRGWDREQVDRNFFTFYDISYTNREYDPKSIMHYSIRSDWTFNLSKDIEENYDLSENDKKNIRRFYPFNKSIPVSKYFYRISGLKYLSDSWILVMSKNTGYTSQRYFSDANFPSDTIKKYWNEEYNITDVCYANKEWVIVMSKDTIYSTQSYFGSEQFPEGKIKEYWDKDYRISHLTYSNGQWIVVMSKPKSDKLISGESYLTSDIFPSVKIKEYWDKDYRISHITYGNGVWAIVLSKSSGISSQTYFSDSKYPVDAIKKYWDEGYDITQLTFGNGQWIVVMSKSTGYKGQSYSTSSHFPSNQISAKWND